MKLVERDAVDTTAGRPSSTGFDGGRHGELGRFWLSGGGRGPVAFDFAAETHPCTLDQIGDSVYVVFDAAAEGRLISVQVLEEELGRSPAWREVAAALVGPTLTDRLAAAVSTNDEVEQEEVTVSPAEAEELREMWAVLHRSVAARLELPPPPRQSSPPKVSAWQRLDRVVALAQPPTADERLILRRFLLPDGFAHRHGLVNTFELRRTDSGLQVTVRLRPEQAGKSVQAVSVQLVEPKASPVVRMVEMDGCLRALLPVPQDLLPGEFSFASLLISTD